MTSRYALLCRMNQTLFDGMASALTFCRSQGNPYFDIPHWLHELLRTPDGDIQRILRHASVDRSALDADLSRALAALPTGAASINNFSFQIERAIERAWGVATLAFADNHVRGAYLLVALLETPELRRTMLDISNQFAKVRAADFVDVIPALMAQSPERAEAADDGATELTLHPTERCDPGQAPKVTGAFACRHPDASGDCPLPPIPAILQKLDASNLVDCSLDPSDLATQGHDQHEEDGDPRKNRLHAVRPRHSKTAPTDH